MMVEIEGAFAASETVVAALEDQFVTQNTEYKFKRVYALSCDNPGCDGISRLIFDDLPNFVSKKQNEGISPDEESQFLKGYLRAKAKVDFEGGDLREDKAKEDSLMI